MTDQKTIKYIIGKKKAGEKITMLTAYDYPMGILADRAGVDIVLVGDSLANVVLGLESTKEVGMQEMLHHTKAVRRAVKRALLVGDMPYEAYQEDVSAAVRNAKRFIDEAGCDAIKLEWFDQCLDVTRQIIKEGIPVMGHVGLTPQTAEKLGGYKVQGKDADSAKRLIENALALEAAGSFCVVLECIPKPIAKIITGQLSIPTIGIGAGCFCDGQVLVSYDLLGLFERFTPKFVKKYTHLNDVILEGFKQFCLDVQEGKFPDDEHSYAMQKEEWGRLQKIFLNKI